jgi:hypothetical protein
MLFFVLFFFTRYISRKDFLTTIRARLVKPGFLCGYSILLTLAYMDAKCYYKYC